MKALKTCLTILFVLCVNTLLFSVPSPPSTSGPTCWPPPCVPIDGGVSLLMVAGAALGAKKIYDHRKKSKSIS